MVRKVAIPVSEEILRKDIEKYRDMAVKLGASDAKIITPDIIKIDERVRVKCIVPKCDWYGTNANCPPYIGDVDFWRETINRYRYGILFKVDVSVKDLMDLKKVNISRLKILEILSKLESEAFYDGYYLAFGLGSGSCIATLCGGQKCVVLNEKSTCRHSLRSRVSMEGVGVDVFSLTTELGWDIYPIGKRTPQPLPPCGIRTGLILIA